MSPRQLLRSREIRAPDAVNDGLSDKQVRSNPDAPGLPADGQDQQQFWDVVLSRLRLNAGSTDWRQGPAGGGGGTGAAAERKAERPEGPQDGDNLRFVSSQPFYPQSLRFLVNGLQQTYARGGAADFDLAESGGTGSGYDTLILAWAPVARDQLLVDYIPAPAGAGQEA